MKASFISTHKQSKGPSKQSENMNIHFEASKPKHQSAVQITWKQWKKSMSVGNKSMEKQFESLQKHGDPLRLVEHSAKQLKATLKTRKTINISKKSIERQVNHPSHRKTIETD